MKILIEGSPLFGKRTGVGQYTARLLEATFKQDTANNYTIFGFLLPGRKAILPAANFSYKWIRLMPGRVYSRLLKKHLAPAINRFTGNADIFLFPNFVRWPLAGNTKSIVIIYDLSFLLHGEHSQNANRKYLNRFVPESITKSDAIITISKNSQREILENFSVNPDKISIIYPAVDHTVYFPQAQAKVTSTLNNYGITTNYILYTGTLEPRKNIVGILDAYAQLPPSLQQEYSLVLAGGKGWLEEGITQKLNELSDLPIITTGYVPDEELPAIYSGASLFVYPSHYEGFGMPPLEAMACGTPVITSDNSSLPEVVGDAGITVPATDQTALAQAIQAVLTNPAQAQKMRKKGLEQAQKFNWNTSAKQLIDVINRVGQA